MSNKHPRVNFARLLNKVQPTESELKKARSHISSCRKRLVKSFNLKKFQRIGSHARSTAIKLHSDLDFLTILAKNEAKWDGNIVNSDTFLNKVSQDLNDRFVHTEVRKDMQAVVANFGNGQHSLDIVPGFFHKFKSSKPIYFIPDGLGGWLETSPEAHNSFINKENRKSGEKLKRIGQLIRFWKHSRINSIPISSFYIDLLLASSGICVGAKSYPQIMYEYFKLMSERECRGLRDPLGIAGVVYSVRTETQGNTLLSSVENSLEHSRKALIAESNKDFQEANFQWNIVFNYNFYSDHKGQVISKYKV